MTGITLTYADSDPCTPGAAAESETWDAWKLGTVDTVDKASHTAALLEDLKKTIAHKELTWRGWIINYPQGAS